jgi:hypothetical protein
MVDIPHQVAWHKKHYNAQMPHHPWEVNVHIWNRHTYPIRMATERAIQGREGKTKQMTIQKRIYDISNKHGTVS